MAGSRSCVRPSFAVQRQKSGKNPNPVWVKLVTRVTLDGEVLGA